MNMVSTKYTFLLPAYKIEFFKEALLSIKKQSLNDFKVLVSDDCSPEDLRSVFDMVVGDDERFTYRRNNVNMGGKSLVSHWNFLVDMCDTEFLIMASDDDFYEPTFLEEIDSLVEKYPSVNLFRGRVRQIDRYGELLNFDPLCVEYETQIDFLYSTFCQKKIMCIANYVIRTDTLKKINGFVEFPLAWNSDDATIMLLSKNGGCNTSRIVLSFRSSGMNISTNNECRVERMKASANYEFALFYNSFYESINKTLSKEESNRLAILNNNLRFSILNSIYEQSFLFKFNEWKKVYDYLKKNGKVRSKLQRLDFFLYWLKNRNN